MLGSLILYLKGMRIMMFQLSGFYYTPQPPETALTFLNVRDQPLAFCIFQVSIAPASKP